MELPRQTWKENDILMLCFFLPDGVVTVSDEVGVVAGQSGEDHGEQEEEDDVHVEVTPGERPLEVQIGFRQRMSQELVQVQISLWLELIIAQFLNSFSDLTCHLCVSHHLIRLRPVNATAFLVKEFQVEDQELTFFTLQSEQMVKEDFCTLWIVGQEDFKG